MAFSFRNLFKKEGEEEETPMSTASAAVASPAVRAGIPLGTPVAGSAHGAEAFGNIFTEVGAGAAVQAAAPAATSPFMAEPHQPVQQQQSQPHQQQQIDRLAPAVGAPAPAFGNPAPAMIAASGGEPHFTAAELAMLVPPRAVRQGAVPPHHEIPLPEDQLRTSLESGRPGLLLSQLYQACPPLFQAPAGPHEDVMINLPPQKVKRLVETASSRQQAPAPVAPPAPVDQQPPLSPFQAPPSAFKVVSGPMAPAFASGAAPANQTPWRDAPAAPAPIGAASIGAKLPPPRPKEAPPAASASSPFAVAGPPPRMPEAAPVQPAPTSPFADVPPQAAAPLTSPFTVLDPGMPKPASVPLGFSAQPASTPLPRPVTAPPPLAGPSSSPFAEKTGTAFPPALDSPFAMRPATEVNSSGLPQSLPQPPPSAFAPGGLPPVAPPPSYALRLPDSEAAGVGLPLPSFPQADAPPPMKIFGPNTTMPISASPFQAPPTKIPALRPVIDVQATSTQVGALDAAEGMEDSGAAAEETISLQLSPILKAVDPSVLGFQPERVPESVRVILPLETVRRQLATGRVTMTLEEIVNGLEPRFQPAFARSKRDQVIGLPLQEIFRNLPAEAEPPKPREEAVPEQLFATPFSEKAREEAAATSPFAVVAPATSPKAPAPTSPFALAGAVPAAPPTELPAFASPFAPVLPIAPPVAEAPAFISPFAPAIPATAPLAEVPTFASPFAPALPVAPPATVPVAEAPAFASPFAPALPIAPPATVPVAEAPAFASPFAPALPIAPPATVPVAEAPAFASPFAPALPLAPQATVLDAEIPAFASPFASALPVAPPATVPVAEAPAFASPFASAIPVAPPVTAPIPGMVSLPCELPATAAWENFPSAAAAPLDEPVTAIQHAEPEPAAAPVAEAPASRPVPSLPPLMVSLSGEPAAAPAPEPAVLPPVMTPAPTPVPSTTPMRSAFAAPPLSSMGSMDFSFADLDDEPAPLESLQTSGITTPITAPFTTPAFAPKAVVPPPAMVETKQEAVSPLDVTPTPEPAPPAATATRPLGPVTETSWSAFAKPENSAPASTTATKPLATPEPARDATAPAAPPVLPALPVPGKAPTAVVAAMGELEDLNFGIVDDTAQLALRALFATEKTLRPQDIVDLSAEFPGMKACIIITESGVVKSGRFGDSDEVAQFSESATGIFEKTMSLIRDLDLGADERTFTLRTGKGIMSFFTHGDAAMAVLHNEPNFRPGVREKLILVTRELGRVLAH